MSTLGQWDGFGDGPTSGTNRSAPIHDCKTCGGDRFVTVRLRSPEITHWMSERMEGKGAIRPRKDEFHEEVAPCPDCATGITYDYWTVGKRTQSPDSAWVREQMAR